MIWGMVRRYEFVACLAGMIHTCEIEKTHNKLPAVTPEQDLAPALSPGGKSTARGRQLCAGALLEEHLCKAL